MTGARSATENRLLGRFPLNNGSDMGGVSSEAVLTLMLGDSSLLLGDSSLFLGDAALLLSYPGFSLSLYPYGILAALISSPRTGGVGVEALVDAKIRLA